MAAIATQPATATGATLTLVAASSGGDTVQCGPDVALLIQNTGTSSVTVTATTNEKVEGSIAVPNVTLVVPASGTGLLGPIDPSLYANAVDGRLHVTYTAVTGLMIAAISL